MRSRVIDNKNLAAIASAYGLGGQLSVNSVQPHLRRNDRILGTPTASTIQLSKKGLMLSHLAGVFEAFVGGLHVEQGLQAVEEWLSQLLSPFISAEYENCRKELRDVNPQDHSELPQCDVCSEPSSLTNTSTARPPAMSSPLQVHDAISPMATPMGSLAELNEKLSQKKIPDQVKWSEENTAPGQSPTFPIWRLTARYEGDVIGEACATRKKDAKNSAAFLALRNLQSRDVL